MFELTNEQRKCFGLVAVSDHWERVVAKPSPYDTYKTYLYLNGNTVVKCIFCGEKRYCEYELSEQLSEERKYLLPKTEKGKPVLLTAASLGKRTGIGMCLSYFRHTTGHSYMDLYSHDTQKCYYSNWCEPLCTEGIRDFQQWVVDWCAETTEADIADVAAFAAEPRRHVKFREGDIFRYKINRRLYGYGRILLDYERMRKNKEDFWDILMGKPLVCSVYHIATERRDVTIEDLRGYQALPSQFVMDNCLYYGEYEIIGNIPVREYEDYPIMYGKSLTFRSSAVHLQCGKMHYQKPIAAELFREFGNNAIGYRPRFTMSILLECIAQNSNAPYWSQDNWQVNRDLRNPKFRAELERVCKQFNIEMSQLIK